MNATERKARKWLSDTRGLDEDKIIFYSNKTPDFILPDGSKFEVKFLYKDKIILFPTQLEVLGKQPDIKVLVFPRDGLHPMATIPADELMSSINDGTMCWQNIKLVIFNKGLHPIQFYVPPETKVALDKYIETKYRKGTRVVSTIAIKALDDFLEREGFPVRKGGEKDEVND